LPSAPSLIHLISGPESSHQPEVDLLLGFLEDNFNLLMARGRPYAHFVDPVFIGCVEIVHRHCGLDVSVAINARMRYYTCDGGTFTYH